MLNFSRGNSKIQLTAVQPSTGEYWVPPKKDTPHPSAREKPQQDSRKGEIVFRIKPYTYQRNSECSNKTLCNQETPQRLAIHTFECLSVSNGGTGQQWPAAVAGALGAAVLGVA